MKWKLIAAVALAAVSVVALAQVGPGWMGGWTGHGPGMMGGWGYGPGSQGWGGGYGPGMMGGWGPGMMNGWRGMGPGPGYGAGPRDPYAGLDLTAEQRAKVADIQRDVRARQWALMDKMHEQHVRFGELDRASEADLRKAFDAMSDARREMFELSLDARKRFDAVLTQEQRDRLERNAARGSSSR